MAIRVTNLAKTQPQQGSHNDIPPPQTLPPQTLPPHFCLQRASWQAAYLYPDVSFTCKYTCELIIESDVYITFTPYPAHRKGIVAFPTTTR